MNLKTISSEVVKTLKTVKDCIGVLENGERRLDSEDCGGRLVLATTSFATYYSYRKLLLSVC